MLCRYLGYFASQAAMHSKGLSGSSVQLQGGHRDGSPMTSAEEQSTLVKSLAQQYLDKHL